MRLALFGSFYPGTQKAGNSSTGMCVLLSRRTDVHRIDLFVPRGSELPRTADCSKIVLHPDWEHDNSLSLLRCLRRLLAVAKGVDGYLFNVHMTSFGTRMSVNGVGLCLPPIVAKVTRKPVVTYMHNFFSTQDVSRLGYTPGRLATWAARALERLLLRTTTVVVPLESQRTTLKARYGAEVRAVFVPYLECIHAALALGSYGRSPDPEGRVRVLMFGHWGPQKDLPGALEALREVMRRNPLVKVTVAGERNVNFLDYPDPNQQSFISAHSTGVDWLGRVHEDDLGSVFLASDLFLLPYVSTGGYSGGMNAAAPWGLAVLSYDQRQLRETADLLGLRVSFTKAEGPETLAADLEVAIASSSRNRNPVLAPDAIVSDSQLAMDTLVSMLATLPESKGSERAPVAEREP